MIQHKMNVYVKEREREKAKIKYEKKMKFMRRRNWKYNNRLCSGMYSYKYLWNKNKMNYLWQVDLRRTIGRPTIEEYSTYISKYTHNLLYYIQLSGYIIHRST